MRSKIARSDGGALPNWVPEAARNYLAHTERGLTIRAIARQSNVHASTILRQVRRFEALRDDPLVDNALRHLSGCLPVANPDRGKETAQMMHSPPKAPSADLVPDTAAFENEAARVMRRLTETGAMLAVARDMEMGVVVRDATGGGTPQRLGVVARSVAEAMALKDWIACEDPSARIARYRITGAGRAALRRMMGAQGRNLPGFAEAQSSFQRPDGDGTEDTLIRHMRSTLAESPLNGLARRKDKDGQPFLGRALVAAGERLREDFELAQVGPHVTQNWERFLTGNTGGGMDFGRGEHRGAGAQAARDRVAAALKDLGPGLADVVLRCCCFLEGLENLERRMGWSARSGKIVLRIALQRLLQHYEATQGKYGPKIG
jgi:hypothetical protein